LPQFCALRLCDLDRRRSPANEFVAAALRRPRDRAQADDLGLAPALAVCIRDRSACVNMVSASA
jgi:hypothetical protein